MTLSPARTLVVSAVCGILLFGLAACSGGGAEVRSEVSTTTVGQQLIDLKKALDSGAMNQQEYEQQRKKILEKQ
jgi:putative oligomerization/nucleic acid binding protein